MLLEDRVAQLEAEEQIRQIVARFAVAYDARDLETLAALHSPQVREATMAALVPRIPTGRTFHLTATPVITLDGPDTAHATVVARAEYEDGAEWFVCGVVYNDLYVRLDGDWYLSERTSKLTYRADVLGRP